MSKSIDRLTPLDRLMLAASRRWPQDIGALAILDGAILLDPAGELRIDAGHPNEPRPDGRSRPEPRRDPEQPR